MFEFYKSHLYLFSQGFSVVLYLTGIILLPKFRKSILLASALALPQAFYSLLLVPCYWNPNRVIFLGIGIEDLIFTFLTGGFIWMGVVAFFRKRIVIEFDVKQIIRRYLTCSVLGIISILLMVLAGIKDMANPFITMALISILLLIFRFRYWPVFLFESIAALVVYSAGIKIALTIWPELLKTWSWQNMWGFSFLKIPAEEMVWALLYGGSWSLAVAFIFDVRLIKKEKGIL